jgi:Iap family predicted aminopeptidase
MHPTLAEIAGEVGANRYESREISDAYLSRSAGLPTLRISTTGREGDDDEEDRPTVVEFTAKLLERIDAEIGPELG